MTQELVNTIATLGTFLVISATAIAAVVQLRHMRGGNQIAALHELRETMESPEFQTALLFVQAELPVRLRDSVFRKHIVDRAARTGETWPGIAMTIRVGNFFETMATLVRAGMIERDLALEVLGGNVVEAWARLEGFTVTARRREGPALWENFEYLTVIAQDWLAANPEGTYPARVRRLELVDAWREEDGA